MSAHLAIGQQISNEEQHIANILIAIICLYGDDGLPLEKVNKEFYNCCGFSIPWKHFGADSLKSWLITLPHIYVVCDSFDREVLIEQSPKCLHIKNLIRQQRQNVDNSRHSNSRQASANSNEYDNAPLRGQFLHFSVNNIQQQRDKNRSEKYEQLESMLPLFYKHQALGDDFFLDIADTKMGYYIPEDGPRQNGLCVAGQTIAALTERVKNAVHLAPRVVVMIGFQDLINDQSINAMVTDLRQLIIELKKKKTHITLTTLIPSPKLPDVLRLHWRMDIFNRAILDYSNDPVLSCNVINMQAVFLREALYFRREFNRFTKVGRTDRYRVFSDYGRKIFLQALKACLKEQLEYEV